MKKQWLIYYIYDPKQEHDDFKRLRFVITPMTKGADERVQNAVVACLAVFAFWVMAVV